jgi:methylphosphotriester-DNA--protein-cysteine methyltransferase
VYATAVSHSRLVPTVPTAPAASAVAALVVDECDRDTAGMSLPRPEIHLVVRFGPSTRERHLRRVFRDAIGMIPKTFARLARFRRALGAARPDEHEGWASIAAEAGYYDQAHLIAEFRMIAGVTPQGLVGELREARALG